MSNNQRDLPDGWTMSRLDEVGKWGSGGTPKRTNKRYYGGNINWVKIGDMDDGGLSRTEVTITNEGLENSSAKLVPPETLLVAMYGSIGKLAITKIECATNQAIAFCKVEASLSFNEFLFFYLLSQRSKLLSLGQGGTQANISQTILKPYPLPLPPLAEQERIVDKIDELFSAIEAGERAIEQGRAGVARYRKAILKAAVTGELTRDWRDENPAEESAEALLERILTARYEAWEKSELEKLDAKSKARPETEKQWEKFRARYKPPVSPESDESSKIPLTWTCSTLDQLVKVETGATPKKGNKEYYENGTIPWVTSTAVNSRNISKENDLITEKAIKETNAKVFPIGTLIIAMYGEGKTRGKVSRLAIDAATNQACAALLIGDLDQQTVDYIEIFFLQAYNRMRSKAAGGVQPNLNLSMIRETSVALPPQEEQAEIVNRVEQALSKADAVEATLNAQARQAKALKQAVLKTAFEGRLVPQNPKDEPASELLKRIKEEK